MLKIVKNRFIFHDVLWYMYPKDKIIITLKIPPQPSTKKYLRAYGILLQHLFYYIVKTNLVFELFMLELLNCNSLKYLKMHFY